MFKDEDFKIKRRRRDNSKVNKQQLQRQVQFADQVLGGVSLGVPNSLQKNIIMQNQIQAAQLAEGLIEEINNIESVQTTEVSNLETLCQSLKAHTETLNQEKNDMVAELKELNNVNDDLKRKFSSLLDNFQEYVT